MTAHFIKAGLLSAFLILGIMPATAQETPRFTGASLTPTGSVRLLTQPVLANPDSFLLESSDSPLGPWWKEAESQRNNAPGGYEYLAPRKPYNAQRFYRLGPFAAGAVVPYIRFISPNSYVRTGLSVTLLGANFNPAPAGNTVTFSLPNQSWTAPITQAATNFLVVTVPANLPTTNFGDGYLYRVTVATTNGVSNGVGCWVYPTTYNTFALLPSEATIIQAPGTGTKTLAVGGGVPPYQLVPQSASDLTKVVAQLDGPVLQLTAVTGVTFAYITVTVKDSSTPTPQQASASVSLQLFEFNPPVTTKFHTLLAGTAPGFTTTAEFFSLQPDQLELRLGNAQIDVSQLQVGDVLALVRLYYSSSAYGFQNLVVTEAHAGRAKFDVVAVADGDIATIAQGEVIENPPTVVLHALGQKAASIMPTTVDQEIIFSDKVFHLPSVAGQKFWLTNTFTSVSSREDRYLPRRKVIVQEFTTTNVVSGAPRIERLSPVQGEVYRNVHIVGTGFDPNPANNQVTFAGAGGTRVPAQIVLQTNNEIVVTVPRNAITGPVRLEIAGKTSNDFSFSVRFHPDAVLVFSGFTNNMPTTPRLIHQQAVDEAETIGEVPLQSVTASLDQGHLVVTNLTLNQQVGVVSNLNFYSGSQYGYPIVYGGQETNAPYRHIFNVPTSLGSQSVLERIYASDNAGGTGVTFQVVNGFLPFNAGIMWDYQFTSPIYRPPALPGTDVLVRTEAVSQQWNYSASDLMRLVVNSTRRVQ